LSHIIGPISINLRICWFFLKFTCDDYLLSDARARGKSHRTLKRWRLLSPDPTTQVMDQIAAEPRRQDDRATNATVDNKGI
jgi:hypothetical protein